tara:strand:- start:118 stop:1089 length:972 start_codon:yes stop_codon:yes gene_type:complete
MELNFIKLSIYLISLLIFFFSYKYSFNIGKRLKLLDNDNVPLLGGIILFFGFILNFLVIKENNYSEEFIVNIYFISCVFLIALADDVYNLKPLIRIFLISIVVIFFIFNNKLLINNIFSYYFGLFYFPNNIFIKFIFPTFCLIVLINAFNFTDGINGLATIIGISWFLYLILKLPILFELYLMFILFLIFFLILNLKNKTFLGDSGNYIISTTIGCIIMIINDKYIYLISVEEILLLLLIPGIDLIRLFYKRIKNGKSPFVGDLDHLHHLLYKKYKLTKSLIIYSLMINVPIYLFYYFNDLLIYLLIFSIGNYYFLISKTSSS